MDPFLGEIRMFAGNFAPSGWASCDGQLLSIAQNTALFSILGTTFGGDGTTTFGLPNLQGSAPLMAGQGNGLSQRNLGQVGGETAVTLNESQMAPHTHSVNCFTGTGAANSIHGGVWAAPGGSPGEKGYCSSLGSVPVNMSDQAIQSAGAGMPHNNMPQYLTVMFIIAMQGIFPSRQ